MEGLREGVRGALLIAVLMTAGDWVWARFEVPHRVAFGLIHGFALCAAIGAVLAWPARRAGFGAFAGAGIGLAAAALFYALAPLAGYAAMFPAWMAFWLAFDALLRHLEGRGLRAGWRGGLAALASGLAFYAISGIWTKPAPGGPDYALHLAAWFTAFLPGFAALLVRRQPAAS
jgi:hypothetical protein